MEAWQRKDFAGDGSPASQKRSSTPGARIGSLRAEFDAKAQASRERSTTPNPTPASLRADAERKEVSLLWERLTQKNKECDALQRQYDDSEKENQIRQKEIEATTLRLHETSSRADAAEKKCKRLERELGSAIGLSLSPSPRGELGRRRACTPPHVRSIPRSPRFGQSERFGKEDLPSQQSFDTETQRVLQNEIVAFRAELLASKAEIEDMQSAHGAEEALARKAEALAESTKLESNVARSEAERLSHAIEQEAAESKTLVQTLREQLQCSEDEAANYKERELPLHHELTATQAVLEQREKEMKSLQDLQRHSEERFESLHQESASDKEQQRHAEESVFELRQQLADIKAQSESLSFAARAAVLQPLTDELKASRVALQQRDEEMRAAQASVCPLREELQTSQTRLQKCEEDSRSCWEQRNDSEERTAELSDQLSQGRAVFERLQKAYRKRGAHLHSCRQDASAHRRRAEKAISKVSQMRRKIAREARENLAEREELSEWRQELVAWWESHNRQDESDSSPIPIDTTSKRSSLATHFFIGDDESSGNDDINASDVGLDSGEDRWDDLHDPAKSPSKVLAQTELTEPATQGTDSVIGVLDLDPALLPNCSKDSRRIARGKSGPSRFGSIFKQLQRRTSR